MNAMLIYMIVCLNCSQSSAEAKPFYSDRMFYVQAECEKAAVGVALNMHLKTGKEYGYKCMPTPYVPKRLE